MRCEHSSNSRCAPQELRKMQFKNLFAWFSGQSSVALSHQPMTLLSLKLDDGIDDDALAFYAAAEGDALMQWAMSERMLMALVSDDRRELNLLIADEVDAVRAIAEHLPSVVDNLATPALRKVHILPVERITAYSQH
jgi:hypothetical protein